MCFGSGNKPPRTFWVWCSWRSLMWQPFRSQVNQIRTLLFKVMFASLYLVSHLETCQVNLSSICRNNDIKTDWPRDNESTIWCISNSSKMYVKKRRPIYVRIKLLISSDVHLLAKTPMKLSFIMVQVVMKDLLNERGERDKFVFHPLTQMS